MKEKVSPVGRTISPVDGAVTTMQLLGTVVVSTIVRVSVSDTVVSMFWSASVAVFYIVTRTS